MNFFEDEEPNEEIETPTINAEEDAQDTNDEIESVS